MNIDEIFNQISNNPKVACSIIASIMTLLLIGFIKRWKWVTDPTGNRKNMTLVEWFGYENYRKIMIVLLFLGIVSVLLFAYMS